MLMHIVSFIYSKYRDYNMTEVVKHLIDNKLFTQIISLAFAA